MSVILYARVSKFSQTENTFCLSLDSQEHEIIKFMRLRNLTLFKVLKDIGSAFSGPQTDLKNLIKSCKNKIILVYEPSRLTRNFKNFDDIFNICRKNNHSIGFINSGVIYNCKTDSNKSYSEIYPLIQKAHQESVDLGNRISRSFRLKKLNEIPWGKIKSEEGNIINNIQEINTSRLIHFLNTKGTNVREIKSLINEVGKMEGKDQYQIVEIINGIEYPMNLSKIPYPMSIKNITDTLNTYEIPRRKYKWSNKYVKMILENKNILTEEEDLCEEFEMVGLNKNISSTKDEKWISFWYDPNTKIIPPNVQIPEGMELPTYATLIYLPNTYSKEH